MRKSFASLAVALASSTLVLPFAFASQMQCDTSRPFAAMTDSPTNIAGAKAAKFQACTTLEVATALYRG